MEIEPPALLTTLYLYCHNLYYIYIITVYPCWFTFAVYYIQMYNSMERYDSDIHEYLSLEAMLIENDVYLEAITLKSD